MIHDLCTLQLVDGLPAQTMNNGQRVDIRYKTVSLRETNVADERKACQLAERVMMVGNAPKLLVSEAENRLAMTMLHCASFHCSDMVIDQSVMNLDTFGKLSSHDLALIEERVFLIELAAQVRYGALSQEAFDAVFAAQSTSKPAEVSAPQPVGQADPMGGLAPESQPGPALLTDFTGDAANSAVTGVRPAAA